MHIDDETDAEQVERFHQRMLSRLEEHGALAGVGRGEAFKVIRDL
jgi:hypothetical protein